MIINGREIGRDRPPYIVCEIGAGHSGSLDKAMKLVDAAKDAGADAVKLQTYTAASLTIDCAKPDFIIKDGLWKGRKLYELYQSAMTPREWHKPLFDYAREIGITMFSTPFSVEDVDFLEELGCPAFKVASFELIWDELLWRIEKTEKPVIISTGMASDEEVADAIEAFHFSYKPDIAVLHCTSGYPTPVKEANLARISHLRDVVGQSQTIGFSDHTESNVAAIAAVALGASIFEKHIGFASSEDGEFALSPKEFESYCKDIRDAWAALQPCEPECEKASRQMRRSIYAVKDIKSGEEFTQENIKVIRPGYGLRPQIYQDVLGKKAAQDIERGTALKEEMVG